jgi:hypothetical protein
MIPTPEQERDLEKSGWRRMPLAAEIALFILTLIAVVALFWFCDLLKLPKGWVTLLLAIAAAELLIRRFRFWRTGIESALWIGGLAAFIFSLPSSGRPEAILVFAAAFAISGWRLRNPLFGTVAVALVVGYLAAKQWRFQSIFAATVIGIAAAAASTVVWRRRSTEALFAWVAVVVPLAGYWSYDRLRVHSEWPAVVLFAAAAAIDLGLGLRYRVRAPLIAGAVCAAIAAFEARDFVRLAAESKLIIAGVVMLMIATAVMRALRGRTTGIIAAPMKRREIEDAVQIAALLAMGGQAAAANQPTLHTGGGEFGGAGASGKY